MLPVVPRRLSYDLRGDQSGFYRRKYAFPALRVSQTRCVADDQRTVVCKFAARCRIQQVSMAFELAKPEPRLRAPQQIIIELATKNAVARRFGIARFHWRLADDAGAKPVDGLHYPVLRVVGAVKFKRLDYRGEIAFDLNRAVAVGVPEIQIGIDQQLEQ